jgi:phosphoribosylformylglycinamidine cyclo-ligase
VIYNTKKPYKTKILEAIKRTWNTPYCEITPNKPYPFVKSKHNCQMEVDHTDGIGTKGVVHWQHKTFPEAVIDALAMNINDLLVARARPFKLQNHLILPKDDHQAIVDIITYLAEECYNRNIVITGGETSIQNNIEGIDLSITMTGFVEKPAKNQFITGDILIGLPSSGIHANGLTFAREHLGDEVVLTTPTEIYWDRIYPYLDDIHGMVHIAGGGFSRLLDVLEPHQAVMLHWKEHPDIFNELWRHTRNSEAMYVRYNCGIGMILSVAREKAEDLAQEVEGLVIGKVEEGMAPGVFIWSNFDNYMLRLENA